MDDIRLDRLDLADRRSRRFRWQHGARLERVRHRLIKLVGQAGNETHLVAGSLLGLHLKGDYDVLTAGLAT